MTLSSRAIEAGEQYSTLRQANIARQKEWDRDNQIGLAYRGNELAGEVGEVAQGRSENHALRPSSR